MTPWVLSLLLLTGPGFAIEQHEFRFRTQKQCRSARAALLALDTLVVVIAECKRAS